MVFELSILLLFMILALYGSVSERLEFNNGICKESGEPWVYFDSTSQGCKGYKDDQGNFTWVSWPGIAKAQNKITTTEQ